jgi:hypothetical protein
MLRALVLAAVLAASGAAQIKVTPVSLYGHQYSVRMWPIRPNCPPPDYIQRGGCIPNKIGVNLARFQVVELDRVFPHVWGPDDNNWLIGTDFRGDAGMPPEIAVILAYREKP